MKKLLAIMVLGLLLIGCETTTTRPMSAKEFERYWISRGYIYTARAQPRSWINAYGLGLKGGQPATGASRYSMQEAVATALNYCSKKHNDCFISHINGSITYEAKTLINEEEKKEEEEEKKEEEEEKKEEEQLAKEKKEKEEEKTEEKEADDDWF